MKLKFFLVITFVVSTTFAGEILIATVAQIQKHVVTSREVQIHFLLDKSLGVRREYFENKNPVEQIIREWLLYYEAVSFYNNKVSSSLKSKAVAKAKSKLSKVKAWKELDVTSEELNAMIGRRLEAERLYLFKKKASVLPVSSAEVETEYTQNRIRYGNLSFDEVKNKIRQQKIQKNLQDRLSQWFLVLEKKYRVQRFAKYNDKSDEFN